jgi:cellulose synthase/poly-beta-1,6-N-acetylglucosamine synthase-like glycosyltransferase
MLRENTFILILCGVLVLSAAVQIFYYLWFYLSVYSHKSNAGKESELPVSIIICARNEAENLNNFLPAVLEQDYTNFEVIVVNDCSEDDSYEVLGKYLVQYPHLKISNVNKDPKFTHNKKFAQFIGIKAAKNDILVFTDADCQPESDKWLKKMVSHFSPETDFVLGYGGYLKEKGLLNKYIRYESMTIAMQYLGMAIRGIPYMGVGRNLAYRKNLFFENKGFGLHNHVISGDDDLFVNTKATGKNTSVEFGPGTHTRSVPSKSLKEWLKQKKRHLTTAKYYKFSDKVLLFLEPFTRILFYTITAIMISFLYFWQVVIIVFTLRLATQVTVSILVQKRLKESGLLGYSLFFDIFSPLINSLIYLSNFRKRSVNSQWK